MTEKMLHEAEEPFGPSNPHPAFGKDPNIANEFGHTHYPKYVKHKETGERVIVNSQEEEEEIAAPPEPKPEVKPKGKVSTKPPGWTA